MGSASQHGTLSTAIVAAVRADTALGLLLAGNRIYDVNPPPKTPFPYITLGFRQESDDNVFSAPGTIAGQVLDIWTRESTAVEQVSGAEQLMAIYAALRALLHQRPLSIGGFRSVLGVIALLATMEDPDGLTLHAVVRYDLTSRQS